MAAFAQQWRERGLDIDISELWYHDERNDVAEYLDARGWTSVGTTMRELLAKNGLPPADRAGGRHLGGRQRLLHLDAVTNRGRRTD